MTYKQQTHKQYMEEAKYQELKLRLAAIKKQKKKIDDDEENERNRDSYDGQASAETGGDYQYN